VVAEVQLLAQQQAPRYEPIELIGMVIMVTGTDITFIIGAAVIAGSVHQMEDRILCRLDIAADVSSIAIRLLRAFVTCDSAASRVRFRHFFGHCRSKGRSRYRPMVSLSRARILAV
jgi:hypothetical protein